MSGLSSPSDGFSDKRSKLSVNTGLATSDDVLNNEILNKIMPGRLTGAFSQVGAQCFQSSDTAH